MVNNCRFLFSLIILDEDLYMCVCVLGGGGGGVTSIATCITFDYWGREF